ncbi:copper amine oxidase N-terminal domain-containing protein [Phosphitispora sp. TUW77]|uniref:copper amine oxidase N-terminal domain-containing protein n=1 Tax=Phosphitispora sp. TUW77 TaxID=3152361 RepID=UPI003AB70392
MKKVVLLFAVLVCLLATPTLVQAASKEITVTVNGSKIECDVKPYIDSNNRTMVPIRFVAEALGSEVSWDQERKEVTVKRRENMVCLWAGKQNYIVNNKSKTMDTVPVILPPGRTMVPVRFVAEALGCTVNWDSTTRTVIIVLDNGYLLPEETDLDIDIPEVMKNPNDVDIEILVLMYKDMDSQQDDLYALLASKFGERSASEITEYVFSKKDRFNDLPDRSWQINNQEIRVGSLSGEAWIYILIYLPGV